MKTAVTAPQATKRYRTGPVSVDSIVSMETSRWIRSACLPEGGKGKHGGNSIFWAEYSTKDLSFNCFAFGKRKFQVPIRLTVLDGNSGVSRWRRANQWQWLRAQHKESAGEQRKCSLTVDTTLG